MNKRVREEGGMKRGAMLACLTSRPVITSCYQVCLSFFKAIGGHSNRYRKVNRIYPYDSTLVLNLFMAFTNLELHLFNRCILHEL